jgi:hypothetical protein
LQSWDSVGPEAHEEGSELSEVADRGEDGAVRDFVSAASQFTLRCVSVDFAAGFHRVAFGKMGQEVGIHVESGMVHAEGCEEVRGHVLQIMLAGGAREGRAE